MTDLLTGPWIRSEHPTVIRLTSPEQPHHAFAMLYLKTGGRGGKACPRMRATANAMLAAGEMLAALRLAKPVCADAYYDALAVQENPTGEAVDYPAENAQATAAALAAWEAVNAAINLAEGRQPDPLDVTAGDTPDATDAEDENPFHPESPEGRAWERGEGREG